MCARHHRAVRLARLWEGTAAVGKGAPSRAQPARGPRAAQLTGPACAGTAQVHVSLLTIEAAKQAEILYGLHAVMKYMT